MNDRSDTDRQGGRGRNKGPEEEEEEESRNVSGFCLAKKERRGKHRPSPFLFISE